MLSIALFEGFCFLSSARLLHQFIMNANANSPAILACTTTRTHWTGSASLFRKHKPPAILDLNEVGRAMSLWASHTFLLHIHLKLCLSNAVHNQVLSCHGKRQRSN